MGRRLDKALILPPETKAFLNSTESSNPSVLPSVFTESMDGLEVDPEVELWLC